MISLCRLAPRLGPEVRGIVAGVYTMADDEMHAVFVAFVVHGRKHTRSTLQSTIVRCATRGVPLNESFEKSPSSTGTHSCGGNPHHQRRGRRAGIMAWGDWQPSPWRKGLNRNRQSQDDGGMKTGSTWLCAVPVAHNVSVMVRAPACGALGYVNAEEFEQLSTNGPCGK